MKDAEKVESIRQKISAARPCLQDDGNAREAIQKCLVIMLDYIEFLVTPCEDDDEDE